MSFVHLCGLVGLVGIIPLHMCVLCVYKHLIDTVKTNKSVDTHLTIHNHICTSEEDTADMHRAYTQRRKSIVYTQTHTCTVSIARLKITQAYGLRVEELM